MLYYLCVQAPEHPADLVQDKTTAKIHGILFRALNANLGQLFLISKLFRCFCGYARGCILTPQFTTETKQKMVDQILDAFAEILGYLFLIEPDSVEEVNPVCGIILTELVTNSSIISKQQQQMIDVNLLQTKEHHQYCVATLAILLSIISNVQLVFQRLDDLDFVTDMLNMQVVKKVVTTQNCAFCDKCGANSEETRIEDDIYYGDLLDHYRHLLPKSQFQTKITMSVIDVNESLCQKCSMQILARGADLSQSLLIQRIPVASIQKNLEVVQECNKELSACQLKQAIQFLQ